MKSFELFVFDLDGTLMDSSGTIYSTTIATFQKMGRDVVIPREELDKRIGAHFKDIFDELGIMVEDIEEYINNYKELYFDYLSETTLYPGVENVLDTLHLLGKKVALLTTKAQDQAEKILQRFNLDSQFHYVMGRRHGVAHKPDPEPLRMICSALEIPIERTVMIGDSEYDIKCGKGAGALTVAVSYGYRSRSLLEAESPERIVDSLDELTELLTAQ